MSETLIYDQQIKLRRGFNGNSKVTYDCPPPPPLVFKFPTYNPAHAAAHTFWEFSIPMHSYSIINTCQ